MHKSTAWILTINCNSGLGAIFGGYILGYMNPSFNSVNQVFGIPKENEALIDGIITCIPIYYKSPQSCWCHAWSSSIRPICLIFYSEKLSHNIGCSRNYRNITWLNHESEHTILVASLVGSHPWAQFCHRISFIFILRQLPITNLSHPLLSKELQEHSSLS